MKKQCKKQIIWTRFIKHKNLGGFWLGQDGLWGTSFWFPWVHKSTLNRECLVMSSWVTIWIDTFKGKGKGKGSSCSYRVISAPMTHCRSFKVKIVWPLTFGNSNQQMQLLLLGAVTSLLGSAGNRTRTQTVQMENYHWTTVLTVLPSFNKSVKEEK